MHNVEYKPAGHEGLQRTATNNIGNVPKLFGIGQELVSKWREEGIILCRAHKNSVQVCVSSVHKAMVMESLGQKPTPINRDQLLKQAKGANYI
jgi:hypothetical protein